MKTLKIKKIVKLLAVVIMIFSMYCVYSQEKYGGIMLYSVRDAMGENPIKALQEVAKIGYKNVEIAGYSNGKFYGMSPLEFKETLHDLGFTLISSHQGDVTLDNVDSMISAVKDAGIKYFVIPVPPMGMFTFDPETRKMGMKGSVESLLDILNKIGKKCHEAGIKLIYHNHDFEFRPNENGVVPIEYLLEHTDPKYVNFEIDLYWAVKAGADPNTYFEKYPGRFELWHVKDMDDQGRFAPVGTGSIDFSKILTKKKESGMEYYFVEQDMAFDGMNPFEAIKISHDNIRKIGF